MFSKLMRTQRFGYLKVFLTLALVLSVCFVTLQACGKRAAECPLCEREVHQGMQVSITHNRIPMKTCCMACALTFQKQTKNVEIKNATDFLSNTPTDARSAFYVIGSDVSPCIQDPKVQKYIREPHSTLHSCYDRCEPGILAFRDNKNAEKFTKEHGGFIRRFQELPALIMVHGREKQEGHHD